MAELIAKGPFEGIRNREGAGVTLAPLAEGPLWSLAVFPGGGPGVARALAPVGLTFPAPGDALAAGDLRIFWTGREQAFLSGPMPAGMEKALADHAAVTDQSGGWAGIGATGTGAVALMSRLVPLDLRPAAFAPGRVARSLLNHVPALILRGEDGFEILVPRSMAGTAWHELTDAQERLEARGK